MTMEGSASSAPSSSSGSAPSAVPASESRATEASQSAVVENPFKGTKHKLKIDGKEHEVDYDSLVADAQKGRAADKKFNEAAQLRKDVDALMQGLAKGDKQTWAQLKKMVPKDVYEDYKSGVLSQAYEFMEYDSLPADEKRQMELDEREKRLREREERETNDAKAKAWTADVNNAGQGIQQLLDDFSERSGKKPNSAELMRMTEFMLAHVGKHGELPPVDKIYERASRGLEIDATDFLNKKSQNVQELLQWMPKSVKEALKKAFMDEATSGQPKRYESGAAQAEAPRARKEAKSMGIDEGFERIEKRLKNLRR